MSGATPFICHYSIVFVDVVAVVEGPSTSVILQEPVTHAIQYTVPLPPISSNQHG